MNAIRRRDLLVPETNLFYNAEVAAARYARKPFLIFYDTAISFARFLDEAERLAGFLERNCAVRKGVVTWAGSMRMAITSSSIA
jgi:fatty-acyl-CoA synthase